MNLPGADHGEVRDDLLRVLRLPGARLSPVLKCQMHRTVILIILMFYYRAQRVRRTCTRNTVPRSENGMHAGIFLRSK